MIEWESTGYEGRHDHEREEIAALKDSDGGLRGSHKDSGDSGVANRVENPPSDCLKLTPFDLYCELRKLIAQETGISCAWEQHPGPVTKDEFVRIYSRIHMVLLGFWSDMFRAQGSQ